MEEPQEKKCRKRAKSFKRRREDSDGPKELRRRLTYYLPEPTKNALYAHIKEHGLKKREFVIDCLKLYFSERKMRVHMPMSLVGFTDRKFMFDEIPNDLWLRVDEATRDREYKRVLNHYHVVEAAVVLALGLQDGPLYKTQRELREEQKREAKRAQPPKRRGRPPKKDKG